MPVRLITADEWRPSIMTERRLRDLEKEGLLRPLTSSMRPEWIAPPAEHREPSPLEGYVVSFIKFHRHRLGSPPSCFIMVLLHHYGIELEHFSPNAISPAAIFAVVWDLWLHLFRGKLFYAPSGATRVRKPVRAGCINIVQKTGHADEPREYILTGLMSNHTQWDSQWFYLRNDDDRLVKGAGCFGRGSGLPPPEAIMSR
jgi:hypothetical protein